MQIFQQASIEEPRQVAEVDARHDFQFPCVVVGTTPADNVAIETQFRETKL